MPSSDDARFDPAVQRQLAELVTTLRASCIGKSIESILLAGSHAREAQSAQDRSTRPDRVRDFDVYVIASHKIRGRHLRKLIHQVNEAAAASTLSFKVDLHVLPRAQLPRLPAVIRYVDLALHAMVLDGVDVRSEIPSFGTHDLPEYEGLRRMLNAVAFFFERVGEESPKSDTPLEYLYSEAAAAFAIPLGVHGDEPSVIAHAIRNSDFDAPLRERISGYSEKFEACLTARWSGREAAGSIQVEWATALRDFGHTIDVYAESVWGVDLSRIQDAGDERAHDAKALREIGRAALPPYAGRALRTLTGIQFRNDGIFAGMAAGLYRLFSNAPFRWSADDSDIPARYDPGVDRGLKIYWFGRRTLELVAAAGRAFEDSAELQDRVGRFQALFRNHFLSDPSTRTVFIFGQHIEQASHVPAVAARASAVSVNVDLTRGPVSRRLGEQAVQLGLGLIALVSFNAVDLFFVSKLGHLPMAALSFTFPVIWLLGSVNIGFEIGTASCVANAVGRGNIRRARRQTTDSAVLAGLVSVIMCLLGLAFMEPLFRTLGAADDLLAPISAYMSVWFLSEPASAVLWTCLASVRGRGNTALEWKIVAAAALLNAILDPILIFGWWIVPPLGIAGAAVATLIANVVALIATTAYLHGRYRVFAHPLAAAREVLHSWKQVLRIGAPTMLANAILPISNAIIVAMVASYGVNAVAAFGIAMRIEPVVLIPFFALAAATSPFFGQNYGAGDHGRMLEAHRAIGRFCVRGGLVAGLLVSLLAYPVVCAYSASPEIRGLAAAYLWIMAFTYGANGLVMASNAAFNGIGEPRPGVVVSVLRTVVLLLPLATVLKGSLGAYGLFVAAAVCNLVTAVVAHRWIGARLTAQTLAH